MIFIQIEQVLKLAVIKQIKLVYNILYKQVQIKLPIAYKKARLLKNRTFQLFLNDAFIPIFIRFKL